MRNDQVGRMYNRTITTVEFERNARLFGLAEALGMATLARNLSVDAEDRDHQPNYFAINLIILRHESVRLGLKPTAMEMADFVRNLPAFRGPNGFDAKKYDDFTKYALGPNGLSEAQLEELARDELCLNRLKELVATGVSVPETEVKTNYDQAYGKFFASVIRVRASDFTKEVKVTDEDIQKYFESHKNALKTDEKRKVEFAALALTEEQRKLKGKERVEPLQKLADRANDLSQALTEKGADFHQIAAKFQLPIESTSEFTQAAPDPKLKDPQLSAAAFQLTSQDPNSEPIQGQDGFYILHLAGLTEARPLTLEEAKPKIVEAIKSSRTREMAANQGAKAAHDLREGLRAGEPLPSVCQKANVKAEKIEPFTLMDEVDPKAPAAAAKNKPTDFLAIKNAIAQLQPGEVSEFFPSEDGGIIVVLEKREPPDEAKYQASKASFEQRILSSKRDLVFYDWLRERQREAGLFTSKS
jgi:parvulin-like peptidyl-prolyl isomerase